jgi:hypothetical protein
MQRLLLVISLVFGILCAGEKSKTIYDAADIIDVLAGADKIVLNEMRLSLDIWQPLDHENPAAGGFTQRVYVLHKSVDKPVVLWLEGYASRGNNAQELTTLLDANQIMVEHRYFGDSKPDSLNWQYLTIENAAADHHRIVTLFKDVYTGKWVNSGISKGGQTTMYHRYFYPADVDASVCYVAPLNFSDEEPRVYDFLNNVGDADCRAAIKRLQKHILEQRDVYLPKFKAYSEEKEYTFRIGIEAAFEYAVLEYDFAFWQWHNSGCSDIPGPEDDPEAVFNHFVSVSGPSFFADKDLDYFGPFFYQALTQIGFYGYDTKPFGNLLTAIDANTFGFAAPPGTKPVFDPEPMRKLNAWMQSKGKNMMFIYGEIDPWSAGAVETAGNPNIFRFIKKGGDHRTRIKSFDDEEKEQIMHLLNRWVN